MAGAYPICTDCIPCPDPVPDPYYVDVIHFDSRVRYFQGGWLNTLWTGATVNSYSDGRTLLGQHTISDNDDVTDCDLIAYFWDSTEEELFAVPRDRSTGTDGTELWRVSQTTHPGFPCKSNNGYVCFIKFTSSGVTYTSTVYIRDVTTGVLQTTIGLNQITLLWATPLGSDTAIGVASTLAGGGGGFVLGSHCGPAWHLTDPADAVPYPYAVNFLMSESAAWFSGTVENPALTFTSGIYSNEPGSLKDGTTFTLEASGGVCGFISRWCEKIYVVKTGVEGVQRWPYTGSVINLGTSAEYTGDRAAYVVEDTFPGGDETVAPAECDCDSGNGGADGNCCDDPDTAITIGTPYTVFGGEPASLPDDCYGLVADCYDPGTKTNVQSRVWWAADISIDTGVTECDILDNVVFSWITDGDVEAHWCGDETEHIIDNGDGTYSVYKCGSYASSTSGSPGAWNLYLQVAVNGGAIPIEGPDGESLIPCARSETFLVGSGGGA